MMLIKHILLIYMTHINRTNAIVQHDSQTNNLFFLICCNAFNTCILELWYL